MWIACFVGGRPMTAVLSQPAGSGPSSRSARCSTSACGIALARFQSLLLSPRPIRPAMSLAEARTIRPLLGISCSPQRNQPYCLGPPHPDDRDKLALEIPDCYEALLTDARGRETEDRAAIEQRRTGQEIEMMLGEVSRPLALVPLEFHGGI